MMPTWEILVALGVVVALAADALAVIEGLPKLANKVREWRKKHKRE